MRHAVPIFIILFMVPFAAMAADPGDIIINEVMQNPDAVLDEFGEWFEVFNLTGSPINLNGWTLKDDGTDSHVIDKDLIVAAQDYAVLGRHGEPAENGGYTPDYVYLSFILANGDDEVVLMEGATEIARIDYTGGAPWPDPTGASMGWVGPPTDYQAGANWTEETVQTYGDGDYGTPGSLNSDSSLPVELSHFSAVPGEKAITVEWITQSEINNALFKLLRSTRETGEYMTICEKPGRGNASGAKTYSHSDENVKVGITYWYKLQTVDFGSNSEFFGPISATIQTTPAPDKTRFRTEIKTNYPNPFNPTTTIRFSLKEDSQVTVQIYDKNGKSVRTIIRNEMRTAGDHKIVWDGKTDDGGVAASGVYFCFIKSDQFTLSGQMLLLKYDPFFTHRNAKPRAQARGFLFDPTRRGIGNHEGLHFK